MTQLMENIFAIEVPVGSYEHFINRDIIYWDSESNSYDFVGLPPGNYSFICASLNLTEDDAATIVEYEIDITGVRAKNYRPGAVTICLSCVESLHSLLRSKGLNPELNFAILRKQF